MATTNDTTAGAASTIKGGAAGAAADSITGGAAFPSFADLVTMVRGAVANQEALQDRLTNAEASVGELHELVEELHTAFAAEGLPAKIDALERIVAEHKEALEQILAVTSPESLNALLEMGRLLPALRELGAKVENIAGRIKHAF